MKYLVGGGVIKNFWVLGSKCCAVFIVWASNWDRVSNGNRVLDHICFWSDFVLRAEGFFCNLSFFGTSGVEPCNSL